MLTEKLFFKRIKYGEILTICFSIPALHDPWLNADMTGIQGGPKK